MIAALLVVVGAGVAGPPGSEDALPAGLGVVSGVVTYDGPLPDPVLNVEAGTRRRPVEVDPDSRGLREAAAWLEGVPHAVAGDRGAVADAPVEVDQVNFEFLPHVLTVEAGRPVAFLNSDVANHGVTASGAVEADRFSLTTPPGGRIVHRFAASRGPVAIGCPVHAAMSAWVFAFDHPYHAVTDDLGRFRLPPVPPGRYTLIVQHPDGGLRRRLSIEVRPGETTEARVDFHAEDLRLPSSPR